MEDPWAFYLEHEAAIRRLAVKMSRDRHDELMSEAAIRMPRMLELAEQRGADNVVGVVLSRLRWYFWQYLRGRGIKPTEPLIMDHGRRVDMDTRLEVQELLDGLDDRDRGLLVARYMMGCTIEEVEELFGYDNYAAARRACLAARKRAKGDK